MRILVAFFCLTFSGVVLAQKEPVLDTIYKLGGRKMVVDIRKVTSSVVTYVYPDKDKTEKLERKQIQRVVYSTGRVEVFNKPVFEMIEGYQWEAVLLTDKPEDVEGLYERGKVSANSAPSSRSPKAAKRSCTIKVRKKAANMKGIIILITQQQSTGGYGEMPGYRIEGVVYGTEPLTEEELMEQGKPLKNGVVF